MSARWRWRLFKLRRWMRGRRTRRAEAVLDAVWREVQGAILRDGPISHIRVSASVRPGVVGMRSVEATRETQGYLVLVERRELVIHPDDHEVVLEQFPEVTTMLWGIPVAVVEEAA